MDTTTSTDLKVQRWESEYFKEYIRDSGFKPYMGTGSNSIIQVKEELTGKPGYRITIPLVTRLTNAGVTGNSVLEGNEEALGNYGCDIDVDVLRHAVVVTMREKQFNAINLLNAAKDQLKAWSMDNLRGATGQTAVDAAGFIDHLGAVFADGTYSLYAAASETTKDAWLENNTDRVLFGTAVSNTESDFDHSDSLAAIDSTNDTLDRGIVSLAKRRAKTADPHIRPFKLNGNRELYVLFANSLAFRDLKADMDTTHQNASVRGTDNPIFQDGDLVYDDVIIREIPEIAVIADVGASTIDVAPNYLCGAQALGLAYAQRPEAVFQQTDYKFRHGVGIMEMRGIRKLNFNDIQHGVSTIYTAGVADA